MINKREKKLIALAIATTMTIIVAFGVFTFDVYAHPHFHKPKVGASYVLKHSKFIFRNHTREEGIKKRSELSDATKKHTVKGIKKAKLKKGTVVTCLEIYKNWIRIPSGWIKVYKDDLRMKKNRDAIRAISNASLFN